MWPWHQSERGTKNYLMKYIQRWHLLCYLFLRTKKCCKKWQHRIRGSSASESAHARTQDTVTQTASRAARHYLDRITERTLCPKIEKSVRRAHSMEDFSCHSSILSHSTVSHRTSHRTNETNWTLCSNWTTLVHFSKKMKKFSLGAHENATISVFSLLLFLIRNSKFFIKTAILLLSYVFALGIILA